MFKLIGIISAAILVSALFGGYFAMRRQQAQKIASDTHQNVSAVVSEQIKLRIYEDEAYLKKSQAIISGTLENVSDQTITGLSVTIKLQGFDERQEELRAVTLNPSSLEPGARASYYIAVPTGKWRGAKVVGVRSVDTQQEYAFKTSRGNIRPYEQPPARQTRTIVVERPAPKKNGEEFLNTPDNPIIIK